MVTEWKQSVAVCYKMLCDSTTTRSFDVADIVLSYKTDETSDFALENRRNMSYHTLEPDETVQRKDPERGTQNRQERSATSDPGIPR